MNGKRVRAKAQACADVMLVNDRMTGSTSAWIETMHLI